MDSTWVMLVEIGARVLLKKSSDPSEILGLQTPTRSRIFLRFDGLIWFNLLWFWEKWSPAACENWSLSSELNSLIHLLGPCGFLYPRHWGHGIFWDFIILLDSFYDSSEMKSCLWKLGLGSGLMALYVFWIQGGK